MLGQPIRQVLPALETDLSAVTADSTLARKVQNGVRHVAQRRNGETFAAEVSTAQVEDEDCAQQLVVIMRDVTEREHLNDLLRKSQEELEQRVDRTHAGAA